MRAGVIGLPAQPPRGRARPGWAVLGRAARLARGRILVSGSPNYVVAVVAGKGAGTLRRAQLHAQF